MRKEDQGFSLLELVIVLFITGIVAQIGFVALNKYLKKTITLAAKTALMNIKKECELNRDLGANIDFTQVNLNSYDIQTRNNNSCLGQFNNDLVVVKPKKNNYPFYFYNFKNGELGCEINESQIQSLANNKESFEGNRTTFRLDGWWGRNDRAILTLNGRDFVARVSDYHLGVRNDDLDEKPASWGYSWAEVFWEQISKKVNESKLSDDEGNEIKAAVSDNTLSVTSKSQIPLDLKIIAYNDQGGNNTKPRFNEEKIVIPPSEDCSNTYNF